MSITLNSYRNKLFGENNNKIFFCCYKDCSICKEWNLPYNTWKSLILFPFHCPGCNFIGYPNDFYLYGTNFMCLECKNKVVSRIKKHIGRY